MPPVATCVLWLRASDHRVRAIVTFAICPVTHMLVAAALSFALASKPDPGARAILDTALSRMGGVAALRSVERMQLDVMTEWQRLELASRGGGEPVILSYELSTELRDYTMPAWRYSRRFYSPNGVSGVVDLVVDSVAAMQLDGRWRAQNVAYVDERDEVFTFAPERVVYLAREAADARAVPDTTIDGVRYARVAATIGRFSPTLYFRAGDGLLALARFRAAQPNDFGLAPWGAMDVEIAYSRWQHLGGSPLVLPMQLDVRRVGRPYKRMTTISVRVNPAIAADSFVVADSLRQSFLASARKPMFDIPVDSARITGDAFAAFGAPGTPAGAIRIGGRWLVIEAGTAPLSIERSVSVLRRLDPGTAIAGALITAPTGAGGTAWLARQATPTWITSTARPYAEAALRGWSVNGTTLRALSGSRWLRVGSDSLRVETVDLPDYPGTPIVYVPALRWAYAWPPGAVQVDHVFAYIRQRGWHVDRVGSARNFTGIPLLAN